MLLKFMSAAILIYQVALSPSELSGQSFHLQENNSKRWWKITVKLTEVPLQNAREQLEDHFDEFEHLIVCKCEQGTNVLKQVLFVDKYNGKKGVVTSNNVDGSVQARVNIGDIQNLYKVTCTAEDANKIGEQKYSEDIKSTSFFRIYK